MFQAAQLLSGNMIDRVSFSLEKCSPSYSSKAVTASDHLEIAFYQVGLLKRNFIVFTGDSTNVR